MVIWMALAADADTTTSGFEYFMLVHLPSCLGSALATPWNFIFEFAGAPGDAGRPGGVLFTHPLRTRRG